MVILLFQKKDFQLQMYFDFINQYLNCKIVQILTGFWCKLFNFKPKA